MRLRNANLERILAQNRNVSGRSNLQFGYWIVLKYVRRIRFIAVWQPI
jgi:hypothetical protein